MAHIYLYRVANQSAQLISPLRVNIDEISSAPSAWVNRTVVVEGKLWGPLGVFVPENYYPWNFRLFRPNATLKAGVSIGVRWASEDHYAFERVIVVGTVKEDYCLQGMKPSICYYIEGREIVRV